MLAVTRVLVLGGRGFIGSHVVAALRAARGVSCVAPSRDRVDLLETDVHQLSRLIRAERADVVVNCVGSVDAPADLMLALHAGVTATLLESVAKLGLGVRLIRLGSAAEYGLVPRGNSVAESAGCAPVGAFGDSHLYATNLVRAAHESGAMQATSLRVFSPIGAGAGRDTLMGCAADLLLGAQAQGESAITLGPLHAWRDFVDVRDVAWAVVAAATMVTAPPPVINIGSGRAVQLRAAVAAVARAAGFIGRIDESGQGPMGVPWTQADTDLATRELRWRPVHTLADSAAALWQHVGAQAALR